MHSSGSEYSLKANSCEHCNETWSLKKRRDLLTRWTSISLLRQWIACTSSESPIYTKIVVVWKWSLVLLWTSTSVSEENDVSIFCVCWRLGQQVRTYLPKYTAPCPGNSYFKRPIQRLENLKTYLNVKLHGTTYRILIPIYFRKHLLFKSLTIKK
jgi:hypothetical protein